MLVTSCNDDSQQQQLNAHCTGLLRLSASIPTHAQALLLPQVMQLEDENDQLRQDLDARQQENQVCACTGPEDSAHLLQCSADASIVNQHPILSARTIVAFCRRHKQS